MKEQWQELKETIIEIRDNNKCNEDVFLLCRFLINYMGVLEEQIQEPCEYAPFTIDELKNEDTKKLLREFKNQRVTTKEPREDEISREWLKTAIHNFYYGLKHIPTEEDIQAYIDIAPHVTPKEKTDSLEKIRAEIEMYEADCGLQGGTDDCEKCNSNVFGSIYRIIDKYKESEVKE